MKKSRAILLGSGLACTTLAFAMIGRRGQLVPLVGATMSASAKDECSRLSATLEQRRAMRFEPKVASDASASAPSAQARKLLYDAVADDAAWLRAAMLAPESVAELPEFQRFLGALRDCAEPLDVLRALFDACPARNARPALIVAIGELGGTAAAPWLEGLLAAGYQTREKSMLRATCCSLGRLRGRESFDILARALREQRDTDGVWQRPVVEALGSFGDEALPMLLEECDARLASDPEGLHPAHMLLGALRNVRDPAPLGAIAARHADARVRAMAAHALGACGTRDAASLLVGVLERETEPNVRGAAFAGIAALGADDALPLASAALAHERAAPEIIRGCIELLRQLDDARGVPLLSACVRADLAESDTYVSSFAIQAVRALCAIGGAESDTALADLYAIGDARACGAVLAAVAWSEHAPSATLAAHAADALRASGDRTPEDVQNAARILFRRGELEPDALSLCADALVRETRVDARKLLLLELESVPATARAELLRVQVGREDDLVTRALCCNLLADASDGNGTPDVQDAEHATKERMLDALGTLRIGQLRISNPDTRALHAQILISFLGRVATSADLPALERLVELYSGDQTARIAALSRAVIARIQVREARRG